MWFGVGVANPVSAWWKKTNDAWAKRRRWIIAAVIAVILLWAWASGGGDARTERLTMPDGYASAGRQLLLQASADPEKPLPLVVVLHDDPSGATGGRLSTPEQVRDASELEDLANRRSNRFAVVYGEAVASAWRTGDPSESQYLRDVVRYVSEERTKIDSRRIYIWGVGEGGAMALDVACSPPTGQQTQFAALATLGQNAQPPSCNGTAVRQISELAWDSDVSKQLWEYSREHSR